MTHESAPLLEARNIGVTFNRQGKRVAAVRDVSLTVHGGEILAIVGESGSGKSTLARTLLGMIPMATGTLELGGRSVALSATKRSSGDRRKVGMVFQDSSAAFNPRFSVDDILREPLKLLGNRASGSTPAGLLEMVGLPSAFLSRRPRDLSGGQRQRLGLARALAGDPELLICDEAVSALDVSVQAQILNLLSDLQTERGLAVLFITHDLSVVSFLADRIAVMLGGQIIETASAADILDRPTHDYTRKLLASVA